MSKEKIIACTALAAVFTGSSMMALASDDTSSNHFYDMAPVVVTANKVEQPVLEAHADISVVGRKEIETHHLENVEQVLRTIPGVQFLNYGTSGMNANLSGIRINGSKDVVILVDGVRITEFQGPGNSGYAYASFLNNTDNIERVEVLRGSSGTIYGSGAKGGVINIITRKIDGTSTSLDVSRGNFGAENYRLYTQGKKDKFDYKVYYNKELGHDYKDGAGVRWKNRTKSHTGGGQLTYHFTPNHSLSLLYDDYHTSYNGFDRIYVGPYEGSFDSTLLTLKDDLKIGDKWSNQLIYRKSKRKTVYGKPLGEGKAGKETKLGTVHPYNVTDDYTYRFLSDQLTFATDRHELILGYDYSHAKGSSYNSATSSANDEKPKMKNQSFYAQETWKVLPWISLSGGIRHDRPDMTGVGIESHTSKSYKLSLDLTDKDTIYAGRSDYFIIPNMYQLFNNRYGNKTLRPAYGRTSTLGYNHKFSDRNYMTWNWFSTISERGVGYSGDNNNGHYVNTGKERFKGWNIQYEGALNDRLTGRLGWAHLGIDSRENFVNYGYQPKDMVTFALDYKWNKWQIGLDGYYFVRIDSDWNKVTVQIKRDKHTFKNFPHDRYAVVNLNLNYAANKDTTIYFHMNNIFDTLYAEHTDVWANPKAGPDRWYSMPGRNFVIGVKYSF